jgi:hypothetical protein
MQRRGKLTQLDDFDERAAAKGDLLVVHRSGVVRNMARDAVEQIPRPLHAHAGDHQLLGCRAA